MGINIVPQKDADGNVISPTIQRTDGAPFKSKVLWNGDRLFRRKHGLNLTCNMNSETCFEFVCPYDKAKINIVEVINGSHGDCVDFKVYDTPTGAVQLSQGVDPNDVVPSKMLNQFGFDVYISEGIYSDKSDYDADIIKDMKIEITYKNNSLLVTKDVSINVVFHEVVAGA